MTNSEIKKDEPNDDQVIAFAISIYESQGYPPNSFEMLDYQMSNKFVKQAQHLIKCGYTRTPEPTKAENGLVKIDRDKLAELNMKCRMPINRDAKSMTDSVKFIEEIIKTFGTPSITKEQLLAILPDRKIKRHVNCDCEDGEGCRYYSDDPIDIECDKLRDLIEQRIEELFKKR